MCKLTKITISYSASRCHAYQKVEVGAVMECDIAPGDNIESVTKSALKHLAPMIDAEADAACREAVRLESLM